MDTTVMGLTIHREPEKPRLVIMGQADKALEPAQSIENLSSSLETFQQAIEKAESSPIPDQTLEPKKSNRGRPKKMAKEKDLSETGTKTIRQDDPGEQGAIGTHGVNAPAQEKVPESKEDKEAQANG